MMETGLTIKNFNNRILSFLGRGFLLAFLFSLFSCFPKMASKKGELRFTLLDFGKQGFFFISQKPPQYGASFIQVSFQWEKKGTLKILKNKNFPGFLMEALNTSQGIYLFFPNHFGVYTLDLKVKEMIDYPQDYSFMDAKILEGKIHLLLKKEKKMALFVWDTIKKEWEKKKKGSTKPVKSWKELGNIVLRDKEFKNGRFLLWNTGAKEKKKEWFFFFIKKGEIFFRRGFHGKRDFSTTLKGNVYDLAFWNDQLLLIGEPKKEKGGLRFRTLAFNPHENRFQAREDLLFPLSLAPKFIKLFPKKSHVYLFFGTSRKVYLSFGTSHGFSKPIPVFQGYLLPFSPILQFLLSFFLFVFLGALGTHFFFRLFKKDAKSPQHLSEQPFFPIAPLWKRGLAFGLDLTLISSFLMLFFSPPADMDSIPLPLLFQMVAYYYLTCLPYFTLCEYFFGKTLGKALFGLKVITDHGKMNFSEAVIRNGCRLIDDNWAWLIGLIAIMLTPKRQRLGDLIAGTYVVEDRREMR
ncbi:MAG: RDD family protein [Planctomycetota bacterium]|nr:MAG: RDD family protein [Planctomycetota bacterium]